MTMLHHDVHTVQTSPGRRTPMLPELSIWLFRCGYTDIERGAVLASAHDTGSLESATMLGHLDPEDREQADEILETSQPSLPYDDPAWFTSPVPFRGMCADADFWEIGPAIPTDAILSPPRGRLVPAELSDAVLSYVLGD